MGPRIYINDRLIFSSEVVIFWDVTFGEKVKNFDFVICFKEIDFVNLRLPRVWLFSILSNIVYGSAQFTIRYRIDELQI